MKKEILAVSILLLLAAGSIYNIIFVDSMTDSLLGLVDISRQLCADKDYTSASITLQKSIDLWLSYDAYAHIFLRHQEIDSVTDAYYELLDALENGNDCCEALYSTLKYHLKSLSDIERPTIGSIL